MSLNTGKNTTNEQSPKSTARPAVARTAPGTRSVMDMNSLLGSPFSRNAAGETVMAYTAALQELLDKDKTGNAKLYRVIPVDAEDVGIIMSCIAITQKMGSTVAVSTLLIESTVQGTLLPATYKDRGVEYEVPSVAGDLYNNPQLWERIRNVVANQYSADGVDFVDVGGIPLFKEIDSTDKDRLHHILHRACNSLSQYLNMTHPEGVAVFNAADWADKSFTTRIDTHVQNGTSSSALPVRKMATINLSASDQMTGRSTGVLHQSVQLSSLSGYIDMIYTGKIPVQGPNGQMIQSEQVFAPNFVITDTFPMINAITLELQLLSLSTATQFGRQNIWHTLYRNQFGSGKKGDIDLTSLAGLGVDLGVTIDTKAPDWDVSRFLSAYVHPDLIYTLHVEEAGDMSWIQGIIREAANGGGAAYDILMAAANNLTNGHFGSRFPAGGSIGQAINDRIILGYYTDKAGNKRDLREIDYLAMCNMCGEKDAAVAIEYAETFMPEIASLEQRLDKRVRILRNILQDSCVIKGYATPVILDPKFLQALFTGIEACGVIPRLENQYDVRQVTDRSNPGILNYALHQQQVYNQYSPQSSFQPAPRSVYRSGNF